MSNEIINKPNTAVLAKAVEAALIQGDLSKLTTEERVSYYNKTCETLGLNPLTKPFDYITLNGKLTLYARKDATEQLRKIYGVSITSLEEKDIAGVYVVTAKAQDREGRTDMAKGAVNVAALKGEALANAIMKAETKAKRRVTLSICGLGILDETEVETIPSAVIGQSVATQEDKAQAVVVPESISSVVTTADKIVTHGEFYYDVSNVPTQRVTTAVEYLEEHHAVQVYDNVWRSEINLKHLKKYELKGEQLARSQSLYAEKLRLESLVDPLPDVEDLDAWAKTDATEA